LEPAEATEEEAKLSLQLSNGLRVVTLPGDNPRVMIHLSFNPQRSGPQRLKPSVEDRPQTSQSAVRNNRHSNVRHQQPA
jgi:hypothetical protein